MFVGGAARTEGVLVGVVVEETAETLQDIGLETCILELELVADWDVTGSGCFGGGLPSWKILLPYGMHY